MKKIFFLVAFLGFVFIAKSQNASIERSTFGIQTGFAGIWAHNEAKLSDQIALRTEIGIGGGFWLYNSSAANKFEFRLLPQIIVEPRWYYNLNKRESKSKRIDGNSGNFISLKTMYVPSLFVISNNSNAVAQNSISFTPTWGIRRNAKKHFTYETGIGVGYARDFLNGSGNNRLDLNLHLRIGFRFKSKDTSDIEEF